MTPEETAAVRELGKGCSAKGCLCLARCYHAFNRWWPGKAAICTHPNWCPPDTEWWEGQPPFSGNKPKPPTAGQPASRQPQKGISPRRFR